MHIGSQARLMPSLSLFLYGVAKRLQLPSFQAHYAKDFPAVTDTALAMTRFGSRSEPVLWHVRSRPRLRCLALAERSRSGKRSPRLKLLALAPCVHMPFAYVYRLSACYAQAVAFAKDRRDLCDVSYQLHGDVGLRHPGLRRSPGPCQACLHSDRGGPHLIFGA